MRIVDAIMEVLRKKKSPMNHNQIFNSIKEEGLYTFGAKDPRSVVRGKLRKHCIGLDFPSSSPVKYFKLDGSKNNKPAYVLYDVNEGEFDREDIEEQNEKELLLEELIQKNHVDHLRSVKEQLLELIKSKDPAFFEKLVVDLLLKMGYGWNETTSGSVMGGRGDEGIDGIVYEDKLNLEAIYVQAKRYSSSSVPSNEIREFIGSIALKGAKKGVFFTTSKFTEQGKKHASEMQGVTLVDGKLLSELLVQYEMAIAPISTYTVYEIDRNFFSDD